MEELTQPESSLEAGATDQAIGTEPRTRKSPQGQLQAPPPQEVGREALVELHVSFRELLTFFCTNATIHGTIRLVCSRQNRLKTASWGLLLLGTLGVLYWQLALLLQQYWSYPVIMVASVHSERKLFPSVTLCDMNPYRPNSVNFHLEELDAFARENIYALYKFNYTEGRAPRYSDVTSQEPHFQLDRGIRLQRLRQDHQNKVGFRLCNSTGGDCFYRAYSSGVAAVREWYRFHYMDILALVPTAWEDRQQNRRGDFVLSCRYDSEDCQERHIQKFYHQTYGSCYTFKGTQVSQHPGIIHGISLVLRTEWQNHFPLLSADAGIKVMVHGHNHTPFLEHSGFNIRPGTQTTIGIREDKIHRLGTPYGDCTEGAEGVDVGLLYPTSYTMQTCLVSCFQRLMVKTCSCGYYSYPLPAGAQYCSHKQHPGWGHCFYRLHQEMETHQLPCVSRCPRPCRESLYKLSAGISKWPSAKSADWIWAALRKQASWNSSWNRSQRGNVAKVNIFYQELNYHTMEEAPVYSIPQLLSAMGSLWSLWFGSSVLSVLELLELLLDIAALALLLGCRWLCLRAVPPRTGDQLEAP